MMMESASRSDHTSPSSIFHSLGADTGQNMRPLTRVLGALALSSYATAFIHVPAPTRGKCSVLSHHLCSPYIGPRLPFCLTV